MILNAAGPKISSHGNVVLGKKRYLCRPQYYRFEQTRRTYLPRLRDFLRKRRNLEILINSMTYFVATTGTLLLARSSPAARQLSQQFQSRVVGKTYLALVRGGEKSFPARSGEIRDALEFNDGRVSIGESCAAKFAATDWELLASSPTAPLSLLKLTLHTGLKHQLRIHLAHSLHTPILGDNVYARSNISEKIAKITRLPEKRIFLHAAQLTLSRYKKTGPSKHFRLGIGAPLPRDFLTICRDAGIPLDPTYVDGGLFVDGQGVDDIPDLEGRWLRKPPVPRS
ncbi:hypothetical protein AZE42_06746 [Rhizopogon vesiculosus]|uniref:Pseudouridine synthase RsuA/RluA-like domain-containing protein n=1 Tax=Rhizopogon vesiculosus TaxID=180088 RepID=A0A1J8QLM1_9AGAM|nr:hypothetical protein AZE42_06746 [Rhizopogon vesiculosus]